MGFRVIGPLPGTPVFPGIGCGLHCARAAVRSFHRGRPGAEKMINYCCYPEEKAVFQFAKRKMSAVQTEKNAAVKPKKEEKTIKKVTSDAKNKSI